MPECATPEEGRLNNAGSFYARLKGFLDLNNTQRRLPSRDKAAVPLRRPAVKRSSTFLGNPYNIPSPEAFHPPKRAPRTGAVPIQLDSP
jgi:hypothetical protein